MGSDGVIANQALTLAFPIQLLIIAIGVGTEKLVLMLYYLKV